MTEVIEKGNSARGYVERMNVPGELQQDWMEAANHLSALKVWNRTVVYDSYRDHNPVYGGLPTGGAEAAAATARA